jgi:cytidylate kinase
MLSPTNRLEQDVEALALAQQYWQSPRPEAGPGLTIALTRAAGTPGTSVAHAVGARLGWQVFDHELLERIAKEMGLRVSLLESVDERHRTWLMEAADMFTTGLQVSESGFVRHLVQTILSLGAHGRCVIVGRGAAHILPAEHTLRVRLVAALEDRVTAAAQRRNLSRQEAARWVEETDRQRERFIKEHFRKDPADPLHYDLVLNASRWSVAECAELIAQAVYQRQARAPGQRAAATP